MGNNASDHISARPGGIARRALKSYARRAMHIHTVYGNPNPKGDLWMIRRLLMLALAALALPAAAIAMPGATVCVPGANTVAPAARPTPTPPPYELPARVPLDEFSAPQPGAPFDIAGDAGIVVDGCWYPILRGFDELKEALGEPLEVVLTDSSIHSEYYDKEYKYDFGSVYTHPVDGVDVWYEIFVHGDGLETSRGISIGDSVEDMLEAYGDVYYRDSATVYVYSISGAEQDFATPSVTMDATDKGVTFIDVFYPVYDQ